MKFKKCLLPVAMLASFTLAGCQSNADDHAADVYQTDQLNTKQETKTVNIISILPAKVAVDNSQNKRNAQAFGALIGAVAGGVIGHNVGSGSNSGTTAGAVGGGAVGAAAGSMVNDKTLVEGVSLTYKEGTKVYTSTQVGKECQFTTGLAVVITTTYNETRIQPIPNVLKELIIRRSHEESFSLRHLSLLKLSGYRLIIAGSTLCCRRSGTAR